MSALTSTRLEIFFENFVENFSHACRHYPEQVNFPIQPSKSVKFVSNLTNSEVSFVFIMVEQEDLLFKKSKTQKYPSMAFSWN